MNRVKNQAISQEATSPLYLTERAARQIRKIIQDESIPPKHYLRVAVKGGGCSGLSYNLEFDCSTEKDTLVSCQGIQVLVDERHLLYLEGMTIDFHDGLDARGFVFSNPNATSTCGCGTSFSA